jgi:hypothetical protein
MAPIKLSERTINAKYLRRQNSTVQIILEIPSAKIVAKIYGFEADSVINV